ncbi:MAG: hypothetical protein J0M12_02935 [Deltaproteobacteria bacterium]|nr:hypothetical protein [Deltaproteobacteria bacterium]
MKILSSALRTISLLGLLAAMIGCGRIAVSTKPTPGAPKFPPTTALEVSLLDKAPARKNVKLAEIVVEPGTRMTDIALKLKIREAAADVGANAVYITSDESYDLASASSGGFANTYDSEKKLRVVKANAIRFVQ